MTYYPDYAVMGLMPLLQGTKTPPSSAKGWPTLYADRAEEGEDRVTVEQDLAEWTEDGYFTGIVIPAGVVVLDWDCKRLRQQGFSESGILEVAGQLLEEFEAAGIMRTPSGGYHFWFRIEDGEHFKSVAGIEACPNDAPELQYLFDIRSSGRSYVRVAPSANCVWLRPLPSKAEDLPLRPNSLRAFLDHNYRLSGGEVITTDYGQQPLAYSKPRVSDIEKLRNTEPELFHALKAGTPLAEKGRRNDALHRFVGIVMNVYTSPTVPPHPAVPFHLLAFSVASDTSSGAPTLANLWDMCSRVCDKNSAQWREQKKIQNVMAGAFRKERREHAESKANEEGETLLQQLAKKCRTTEQQMEYQAILVHDKQYYMADPDVGGYEGPFSDVTSLLGLEAHASKIIGRENLYNSKNAMRQTKEIIRDYGQQVASVLYDTNVDKTIYYADSRQMIRPAWEREDIEPHFDTQIDEWLRALAGKEYGDLENWIATLPMVQYPTSCLYLQGPTGVGKTMLMEGLARIWKGPRTSFEQAIAPFNQSLMSSPLVFVEEGLTAKSDSKRFRELLTSETHEIRIKFQGNGQLRGHPRMVVGANNSNALRLQDSMTTEDMEAVSRRLLWIRTSNQAAHYLVAIGGRRATEAWVRESGLARHALYLHQQFGEKIKDRMDRLLVPGNSSPSKQQALLNRPSIRTCLGLICHQILRGVSGQNLTEGIYVTNAGVTATWEAVNALWALDAASSGRQLTEDAGRYCMDALSTSTEIITNQQNLPQVAYRLTNEIIEAYLTSKFGVSILPPVQNYLKEAGHPLPVGYTTGTTGSIQ